MTEFVTIKPGLQADGKTLRRVPMPSGLGLPGVGSLLPDGGRSVPLTPFVKRLLADKDAVLVETEAATDVTSATTSSGGAAAPAGATVSNGGSAAATTATAPAGGSATSNTSSGSGA